MQAIWPGQLRLSSLLKLLDKIQSDESSRSIGIDEHELIKLGFDTPATTPFIVFLGHSGRSESE